MSFKYIWGIFVIYYFCLREHLELRIGSLAALENLTMLKERSLQNRKIGLP